MDCIHTVVRLGWSSVIRILYVRSAQKGGVYDGQ